jgi:pilus assembly protein TadC
MKIEERQILILENSFKRDVEHTKSRLDSIYNNQKLVFEEFKLKYENNNSILDYLLSILRQFLALGVTGYLGLLALPSSISDNIQFVQSILMWMIFSISVLILFFIFAKISLAREVNSIVNERLKTKQDLLELEDKLRIISQEQLAKIDEIKQKIINMENEEHLIK